ncbi:hypothetical protein M3484_20745 [Pseudomonas sp. GX19020]|uniref:hypothetical protein n=1 Tax=Pseudomonas sp. GX19020 TaxID=2942277 RepID=UPI002019E30A|nr:hypothetical protein [Pseudomonas sp. GX19020]MCL4068989.1 hypothetical protein [Pseudomonas sp. GX19020]
MPLLPPNTDPEQIGVVVGAAIAFLVGALVAWIKGARKSPVEVGSAPPPVDQTAYVLAEVRQLAKSGEANHSAVMKRLHEQDERLHEIYTDTQVIRDRGRG